MKNEGPFREQTTTGALCEYITSGSRDWKSYYSDKGAIFIRTQDINKDRLNLVDVARVALPKKVEGKRSLVEPGDLLVTITGANVGKVAVVPPDIPEAYVSQSVGLMRLKDKRWAPYLHYYLQSDYTGRKHLTNLVYGIGRPVLSLQNLRDVPVALPPLGEQRRIVAEIEKQFTRLDAGTAALRRTQANLKRYRAAVLKAACEGRVVPTEAELKKSGNRKSKFETGEALLARILTERRQNWRGHGKYKEPVEPATTDLPTLPAGWTWASLAQIALSSSYGTSAKCSPVNTGPPVLRIPNIAGGRIDLTDLKFAGVNESIDTGDELAPGDLLIIRTNGSKNLIGRSAVVRTKLDRATSYASYLIRFRLFGSPSLFDWIGTAWDVSFLRAWIEQRAATSAGQHNISMSVLSAMPIPLPPLAEQTRIVAEVERRLSVVEELETVVNANLQRATRLRQSILQQAFTGELT